MSWNYGCPKCGAMLNPKDAIAIAAQSGDTRVLIGFHPQPGNYEVYLPPGVKPEPGSVWNFYCPVCQADLVAEDNDRFCALDMKTGDELRRVLFSRVAGEQATFVFNTGGLEEHHGEAADVYIKRMIFMKYQLM
jgi:hypothetical protein